MADAANSSRLENMLHSLELMVRQQACEQAKGGYSDDCSANYLHGAWLLCSQAEIFKVGMSAQSRDEHAIRPCPLGLELRGQVPPRMVRKGLRTRSALARLAALSFHAGSGQVADLLLIFRNFS